jgi:hypothetical protein
LASVIWLAKLSVPVPATAVGVPVSVKFQLTEFVVVVGPVQLAVTPVGRPAAIATLAPAASEGTVTPPIPVAVTVSDAVPIEDIFSAECESTMVDAGACNTWTL